MKQFYVCIDALLPAPQPEQHELCRKKALLEGGQIVFYGAEEYSVARHQPFILNKLQRSTDLAGVIFFTIDQFCYGEEFNLLLLTNILNLPLSVHFARENISLQNTSDLNERFLCISAYFHSLKRRRSVSASDILGILC